MIIGELNQEWTASEVVNINIKTIMYLYLNSRFLIKINLRLIQNKCLQEIKTL